MDAQLPKPARVSCLEEHREVIALSRRRKCSYRTIAVFLLEQHSLKISHRAIREFCCRRGIVKGKGETVPLLAEEPIVPDRQPSAVKSPVPTTAVANLLPKFRRKKLFIPDEGPIRTRSNGGLEDDA